MLPADSALLAQGWPHSAAVSFEAVAMAYRPGLPLVLEHVSFSLPGGVKAAVVGRSGAGKSSLTVALLRLVPLAAGAICIDGVDIASVGLQPYEPRLQPRVPRLRHRTHLRTLRLHLCVLYTPGRPAGAAPRDHLHPAGRGALRWVTPVQPRPLRRALGCNPRGGTSRGRLAAPRTLLPALDPGRGPYLLTPHLTSDHPLPQPHTLSPQPHTVTLPLTPTFTPSLPPAPSPGRLAAPLRQHGWRGARGGRGRR